MPDRPKAILQHLNTMPTIPNLSNNSPNTTKAIRRNYSLDLVSSGTPITLIPNPPRNTTLRMSNRVRRTTGRPREPIPSGAPSTNDPCRHRRYRSALGSNVARTIPILPNDLHYTIIAKYTILGFRYHHHTRACAGRIHQAIDSVSLATHTTPRSNSQRTERESLALFLSNRFRFYLADSGTHDRHSPFSHSSPSLRPASSSS